jgi:hypothetical protein
MFIIEVIKMHGYINEILKALKMYLWNHLEIHVCQYTRLQDIWEHFLYSIYTVYLQWKSQHLVKIEYVNMTFQHFLLSLTFFFFLLVLGFELRASHVLGRYSNFFSTVRLKVYFELFSKITTFAFTIYQ